MKHPTTEECLKLLEEYGTPTRVKGHCRAVADTACRIGEHSTGMGIILIWSW